MARPEIHVPPFHFEPLPPVLGHGALITGLESTGLTDVAPTPDTPFVKHNYKGVSPYGFLRASCFSYREGGKDPRDFIVAGTFHNETLNRPPHKLSKAVTIIDFRTGQVTHVTVNARGEVTREEITVNDPEQHRRTALKGLTETTVFVYGDIPSAPAA